MEEGGKGEEKGWMAWWLWQGVNFVETARIVERRRQGVAAKHSAEGEELLETEGS